MSAFIDCIMKHVAEKNLDKQKAEALIKKYNDLKGKYEKFQGAGSADKAAQDLVQTEADEALRKARVIMGHALKLKEIDAKFARTKGPVHKKISNELQTAEHLGTAVKATAHSYMNEVADKIGASGLFGTSRDHGLIKKALRSMLGETVDDPDATKIGEVFKKTFDYLHSRYESANGTISNKNYLPDMHRAQAMGKVEKGPYVDYTLEKLNQDKMIDPETGVPFTTEKLKKHLGDIYDDVTTGGRKKKAGPEARSSLVFNTPDDFLAYNSRFGVGDDGIMEAFLEHIEDLSKNIGILETLGPKPDQMAKVFKEKMLDAKTGRGYRDWVNAEYRVLKGLGGEENKYVSILFTGSQNWIKSAVLGTAPASAMSDVVFMSATAKINGLSVSRALGNYGKMLSGVGAKELNETARKMGFLGHILNGDAVSDVRFAGETMSAGKFTKGLANATNKLSGLGRMTRTAQNSIALDFNSALAELVSSKTTWGNLDPKFKYLLSRADFNEDDWGKVLNAKTLEEPGSGTKFLMTNDLRADASFDPRVAKKLADKLDILTMALRQEAANESGLATRAITTGAILGDGSKGSVGRYLSSSVFMFKSFAITATLTHLIPALRSAGFISGREGGRKFDHLMMITIGTAMVSSVSIIARDLIKGKTIEDPDRFFTPRLLVNSLMQGGGLGLFGDFLFRDSSRFGRGVVTEMLGPHVGLANDIYDATQGNFDKLLSDEDPNFLRDTFRITKRNIPVVGSLWYTRLALERLLLDNMERLIDPRFDSKMRERERKIFQEKGQKYWWR